MIVLKSGHHVDAVTVIEDTGFVDITPDVSTATHKFSRRTESCSCSTAGTAWMKRETGRMSSWCR